MNRELKPKYYDKDNRDYDDYNDQDFSIDNVFISNDEEVNHDVNVDDKDNQKVLNVFHYVYIFYPFLPLLISAYIYIYI
jgi:hypothetical protein